MDHLEVVGRHALLFDDDTTSAFVNSSNALVEWNSLLIDRYDVRHLLQQPPPPLKRRRHHHHPSPSSSPPLESDLDRERYLDLPPEPSDEQDQLSFTESHGAEPAVGVAYKAVAFSYGNSDVSTDHKNFDTGSQYSGFLPPFSLPESLHQNLPPTEKAHQIIARTAMFVSKHGGQSEIVLRVKQGDNPTFGFLMPDHHLHVYFRFLVDHPELLKSDIDVKPQEEEKRDNGKQETGDVASEALSLLGSVYGSGEDEDGAVQIASESKEKEPGESLNASNATFSHGSEGAGSGKDEGVSNNLLPTAKEKIFSSKRNRSVTSGTTGSKKREGDAVGAPMEKPQASTLANNSKVERVIFEPPSHLKRIVDKIVEFIMKNGKEFEAVLIEQDGKNGRFPFLLPSNQYHSYYQNVLQKALESKLPGKSSTVQKHDSTGYVGGKRNALSKGNDISSKGSASHDIPYDSERKEKFKMVIGGSKKDAQDLQAKPAQQQGGFSVDAVAAILLAATRGTRNSKLDILPKSSVDDPDLGLSGEGGPTSSPGSLSLSSRARSSSMKPVSNGAPSIPMLVELSKSVGQSEKEGSRTSDVSVAKAIAKTAALVAASEADSSEACLTREQKQKAERLKRAKMFAVMIKGGVAPRTNELLPRLSAEPPDSVHSGLLGSGNKASIVNGSAQAPDASNLTGFTGVVDLVGREREGSSVPVDVDASVRMDMTEKKDLDDDYKEQRSRKKYRSRSSRVEDSEEEGDHKHSRKKHRSHHSSHHSRDEHKHRRRHSSPKDRESCHRHKHHSSSEDDYQHRNKSDKRRRSHSERKVDIEEGEIITEHSVHSNAIGDSASREASLDLSNDRQNASTPSVADTQPSDTTEVSDDLRAKVRAMLLATM